MNIEHIPWQEAVGLLDSVTQVHPVQDYWSWVDRFGRFKYGAVWHFSLNTPTDMYDSLAIKQSEIGVQTNGFDALTGAMNPVEYIPAYSFCRKLGRTVTTGVVIARTGHVAVPLMSTMRSRVTPSMVVEDLRRVMLEDN